MPSTVLIVDDSLVARKTLTGLLARDGYAFLYAESGAAAIELAMAQPPDVILLDVMLPDMDGYTVCRHVRARPPIAEVPILLVTALDDRESRLRGLEAGADDFVCKPPDPDELRARLRTITRLNRYRSITAERTRFSHLGQLSPDGIAVLDAASIIAYANPAFAHMLQLPSPEDAIGRPLAFWLRAEDIGRATGYIAGVMRGENQGRRIEVALTRIDGLATPCELVAGQLEADGKQLVQVIARDVTERRLAEAQIQMLNRELLDAYDATLEGWALALELRDHETQGHSRRVTEMTLRLARRFGLDEAELQHIRRGALLHDIGKMAIPDAVLLKPGRLNREERLIIEQHPVHAYDMLNRITFLWPALDIPHFHHERWDGQGYPVGLQGEAIPLAARLFAVVDVWDALSSDRPYRRALPHVDVQAELLKGRGSHFDPDVLDAFVALLETQEAADPLQSTVTHPG